MDLSDKQWELVCSILPEDPVRCRSQRSPLERPAHRAQRDPLDSTHRSPMGGSAGTLRKPQDGAPTISELGEAGVLRRPAGCPGRGSPRPRLVGSGGMLHRRDICFGEKRGLRVGKTKPGRGTKVMAIVDGNGLPIAGRTESASPAEVGLVEPTLEHLWVVGLPTRLIGDKAYDSDPLDRDFAGFCDIEMIPPNRSNRKHRTQDGRPLRRYQRRWKVERLLAWLHNFRSQVVRWEYHAENFAASLYLGCAIILLRHL